MSSISSIKEIRERLAGGDVHIDGQPNLKSLDGGAKSSFDLFPPDLLLNAKTGMSKAPWIISNDDALNGLRRLPDNLVDCVVTSPPYYWQRDYAVDGQTGHEDTVEEFIAALTDVFQEVMRVLKPTGTAFIVMGDTYYSGRGQPKGGDPKQTWRGVSRQKYRAVDKPGFGLPKKSLIGVPWRLALSLQQSGWTLRSSIIWRKPKALAEPNVKDRPWTTTENIFMLSKSMKYHFMREGLGGDEDVWDIPARVSNRRYKHAAPFPEALVERCLAVGCPDEGVVLDPYAGSGTSLAVATASGMTAIGFELNPRYCALVRQRLTPLSELKG